MRDGEPGVARLKAIGASAMTMSRAGVCAERTDTIDNRIHAGEDFLHIIVLNHGRVQPEMLACHFP